MGQTNCQASKSEHRSEMEMENETTTKNESCVFHFCCCSLSPDPTAAPRFPKARGQQPERKRYKKIKSVDDMKSKVSPDNDNADGNDLTNKKVTSRVCPQRKNSVFYIAFSETLLSFILSIV